MNLMTIFQRYPDQEACMEHLERVRWGDDPHCPQCGSTHVARKAERHRIGRWNCHDCHASFNALSGTIFEKTKIPLQKWFMAIGIMVNAKKSVSSFQLARDLDLNQKSAWYMQQRIRAAMAADQAPMLQGIVEADETFVGGKPRKRNRRDDDKPSPRGRGTKKTPVIGAVERGGQVSARVATDLSGKSVSPLSAGYGRSARHAADYGPVPALHDGPEARLPARRHQPFGRLCRRIDAYEHD